MKKISLIIICFLIFTLSVICQENSPGKIVGMVMDKRTDEPLAGVNIQIKGTYMGAASDPEGWFMIENINPGQYDVEASIIGYKIQLVTGVVIVAGETKKFEFLRVK